MRAAVLAVLVAFLGSCRVGPILPPGCKCGAPSVITRGADYAGDLSSMAHVVLRVEASGATSLVFTRNGTEISESFSSAAVTSP